MQDGAGPGLPWRGPSAWAAGTSRSRGVGVLVQPGLHLDCFECIHRCPSANRHGSIPTAEGMNLLRDFHSTMARATRFCGKTGSDFVDTRIRTTPSLV